MLEYGSISELVSAALESGKSISEVVIEDQAEQFEMPFSELYRRMEQRLAVMEAAVKSGMNPNLKSTSGLTGGEAARLWEYAKAGGITGAVSYTHLHVRGGYEWRAHSLACQLR